MDTDDIPVLTEVYQTNQASTSGSLSDDQVAAIASQLEADLAKKLTQSITSDIREEFAGELKTANETIAKLEKQLASKGAETAGPSKALETQHEGLLKEAKHELSDQVERLSNEHSEKMNLDIAAKITGMQELAVSQVKAQLASSIKMFEDNLRVEVTKFKEKEEGKLKTNVKAHFSAEEKAIKEAFEKEQKVIKDNFSSEQKKLHDAMQKAAAEQSERLTKETTDSITKHVGQLSANQSNQINQDIQKQLSAIADNQKTAFLAQLDKELPEVKKVLEERVDEVFEKALPEIIENINAGVMTMLQDSISQVKLVLPDAMPKVTANKGAGAKQKK